MENIDKMLEQVFGPYWNQTPNFAENALEAIHIIWPLSTSMIFNDTLTQFVDFVEDNQLRDPLLVFENDVFFTLIHENVSGFTVEEVSHEGKTGLLCGYPYFCRSGLFHSRNQTGMAVIDRETMQGQYIVYSINR